MIYGLRFRPEAMTDIKDAFIWYEAKRKGLGEYFLHGLEQTLNEAAANPFRFPRVHEVIRKALIKRFPYAVFFVEEQRTIMILAVFHQKRNPEKWRERMRSEFHD